MGSNTSSNRSKTRDCLTGTGNIFNATLIVESNTPFDVIGDIGCVGSSVNTGGQFSYATIWADDPLTSEKDGLENGDTFILFPFPMEADAIYTMTSATVDTTFSALLDSLTTELALLSTEVNNIVVERDSLQGLVDNFPASVQALQNSLNIASNRVIELEADLRTANLQFPLLISIIRNMADKLRN